MVIIPKLKYSMLCLFLLSSFNLLAECETDLGTSGTITIKGCDPKVDKCIPASKALYDYMEKGEDDSAFTIAVTTSPWRLYDQDNRIIRIEELAAIIKPALKENMKSVKIFGSWSGVRPDKDTKSIAEKLSLCMDNFPVSGIQGFLWVKSDGSMYTTKQAFTLKKSGQYLIKEGDDVMDSLASGWLAELADDFIKNKDAKGLVHAGVAWDCYLLCEDKALEYFELAAELSNPVAAYNAAIIYIDRGGADNLVKAKELLDKAAKLGDLKSKGLLTSLEESETNHNNGNRHE